MYISQTDVTTTSDILQTQLISRRNFNLNLYLYLIKTGYMLQFISPSCSSETEIQRSTIYTSTCSNSIIYLLVKTIRSTPHQTTRCSPIPNEAAASRPPGQGLSRDLKRGAKLLRSLSPSGPHLLSDAILLYVRTQYMYKAWKLILKLMQCRIPQQQAGSLPISRIFVWTKFQ